MTYLGKGRVLGVAVVATLALGCGDGTQSPVAVISSVAEITMGTGDAGTCLGSPSLDAQVGMAPSISGGCSFDPEGDRLEYSWDLVDAPTGSMASLFDPTLITPTFVPDVDGKYVLSLVVTAGGRASEPVLVDVITSGECGVSRPVADAQVTGPAGVALPAACGGDIITVTATPEGKIMIDASGSLDPDNNGICGMSQRLDYLWEVMSTPIDAGSSRFDNPNAEVGIFDARENGLYAVRLIVTDETGATSEPVECVLDVTIP